MENNMLVATAGSAANALAGRREPGRATGFSLGVASRPSPGGARTAGITGTTSLASLDAFIALQAVPGGHGRRRRAVRRGQDMLDRLDELRLALLDARPPGAITTTLRALVDQAPERSDEPELAAALREIEVRAAVELAKIERGGATGHHGAPV